jgi:hypothetical protein
VQTQMKIANANAGAGASLPILSKAPHPDGEGAKKTDARPQRRAAMAGEQPDNQDHPHAHKVKRPTGLEFQVIRASDFVCFDAEEHLDFEASKKVLEELARACRKRGLDRAMIDLRDLPVPEKPRFTRAELAEMAGAFRAAGFSISQRLAVLHAHDTHGTVRDFVSISQAGGLQVAAFLEFDKAVHWLGKPMEKEHHVEYKHGDEVPIVRKAKAAHGREGALRRPRRVQRRKETLTEHSAATHAPGPTRRFRRDQ